MSDPSSQLQLRRDGDDVLIPIKVVPGASRDQIAGVIGERLKIRIGAPREDGKANRAIWHPSAKWRMSWDSGSPIMH